MFRFGEGIGSPEADPGPAAQPGARLGVVEPQPETWLGLHQDLGPGPHLPPHQEIMQYRNLSGVYIMQILWSWGVVGNVCREGEGKSNKLHQKRGKTSIRTHFLGYKL